MKKIAPSFSLQLFISFNPISLTHENPSSQKKDIIFYVEIRLFLCSKF